MPFMAGGGDGRADRNVMFVLFSLAALVLLSVGVAAVPEEHKAAVQVQTAEEVKALTLSLTIKTSLVVGRKLFF